MKLGKEDVKLNYTMASVHYLTSRHGDLSKVFEREDGIDAAYIERIADIVYAGLIEYDDDGKDISGWSRTKVMNRLKMSQLNEIVDEFTEGMKAALPEADPTKAEKGTDGSGTGTTS